MQTKLNKKKIYVHKKIFHNHKQTEINLNISISLYLRIGVIFKNMVKKQIDHKRAA